MRMLTYADVCAEREESRTQGEIEMSRAEELMASGDTGKVYSVYLRFTSTRVKILALYWYKSTNTGAHGKR